jgi:hypothetical protein
VTQTKQPPANPGRFIIGGAIALPQAAGNRLPANGMTLRKSISIAVCIVAGIIGFGFMAEWGNRALNQIIAPAGDDSP